ncbi:hypothetical protein COO60DRAFT_1525365 [Scenedesmus sp. NREL 46B-D3]|nr:hypothetical protein COO60DRAFT_1525365 [Scenedesmus sp. NREL 46B-D3]
MIGPTWGIIAAALVQPCVSALVTCNPHRDVESCNKLSTEALLVFDVQCWWWCAVPTSRGAFALPCFMLLLGFC